MARDIKKWIRSCNVCSRVKPDFRNVNGTMAGISIGFNWTPSEILC